MEDQKHTAESIMELINSLPIMERIKLHDLFKGVQTASSDMEEYLTEQRFSDGRVCPICGGTHVQRNGKRKNGAQKFICKDCGKTFSIRKNTIFNGTRKSLSVWREYMSCMAEGLTIDQSAERCGITHYTSFIWRHKILDALGECSRKSVLNQTRALVFTFYFPKAPRTNTLTRSHVYTFTNTFSHGLYSDHRLFHHLLFDGKLYFIYCPQVL